MLAETRRPRARAASILRMRLRHLAPVGLVGGLEVPDLGRDLGALGNRDHLVERLHHLVALGALVGDVDAAVLGRGLRQRHELVGGREAVRDVLQRRADAERALAHRAGDQRLHLGDLVGGRRPVGLADDVVAQAAGADEGADVDGRGRALEPGEVLVERAPVLGHLEEVVAGLAVGHHLVVHRRNRHAFAGDLGGDALGDLAGRPAVDEHVELGLAEQVDEAGRHHQAGGVDPRRGLGRRQVAERGDPVAGDADVGAEPRGAGAVDDLAVGDHDVEGRGRRRAASGRRGRRGGGGRGRRAAAGHRQDERERGNGGTSQTHGADCIVGAGRRGRGPAIDLAQLSCRRGQTHRCGWGCGRAPAAAGSAIPSVCASCGRTPPGRSTGRRRSPASAGRGSSAGCCARRPSACRPGAPSAPRRPDRLAAR